MNIPKETRRESYDKVLPAVKLRQSLILALLQERGPMTAQEVADELHSQGHTASGERMLPVGTAIRLCCRCIVRATLLRLACRLLSRCPLTFPAIWLDT